MPGHFTTLWKLRSIHTPSGLVAWEAAEYIYSARTESVNGTFITSENDYTTSTEKQTCIVVYQHYPCIAIKLCKESYVFVQAGRRQHFPFQVVNKFIGCQDFWASHFGLVWWNHMTCLDPLLLFFKNVVTRRTVVFLDEKWSWQWKADWSIVSYEQNSSIITVLYFIFI
jgi:hypothetical protein